MNAAAGRNAEKTLLIVNAFLEKVVLKVMLHCASVLTIMLHCASVLTIMLHCENSDD